MRKWAIRFGLLVVGLCTALVFGEIALRVTRLAPTNAVFTVSERDFERLPGIWEPGQDQLARKIDYTLPYRFTSNSHGYRGLDFQLAKPQDQFRILYVGDSFAFGEFVDDDETLPARLEQRLSAICGNTLVVNAGLGGSTITEHEPMIERGLLLDPDLVILQFSENDVSDLAGGPMWDQLRQNRQAKSRFPLSTLYPIVRRTAVWGLALKARAVARTRRNQVEPESQGVESDQGSAPSRLGGARRERYARLLADLSEALARRGYPMLFVELNRCAVEPAGAFLGCV